MDRVSKGAWKSILSIVVIVCVGFAGAFWIQNYAEDQLTQKPLLAASEGKAVSNTDPSNISSTSNTSDTSNKSNKSGTSNLSNNGKQTKTKKEIIEASQKRVVTIESAGGLGTGFLYNNQGDLLTNAHVVEGYSEVTVRMLNHKEYKGTVIGIGDDIDIAVVRVPELKKLDPLPISTTKAETGDEILALGSPLGLENTVTTGIISGMGRNFEIDPYVYTNMYQISAFITHGNSGGPLVSATTGEVLGINSASASQEAGIGFSIPITQILKQAEAWSKKPMNEAILQKNREGSNAVSTSEQLVTYFYNAINSGDYVSAYAVLGSQWQSGTSYENFRKGYLYTSSVVVEKVATIEENLEGAKVSAVIEATERHQDGTVKQRYEVNYTLSYENGVLKLQKGVGKKLK